VIVFAEPASLLRQPVGMPRPGCGSVAATPQPWLAFFRDREEWKQL